MHISSIRSRTLFLFCKRNVFIRITPVFCEVPLSIFCGFPKLFGVKIHFFSFYGRLHVDAGHQENIPVVVPGFRIVVGLRAGQRILNVVSVFLEGHAGLVFSDIFFLHDQSLDLERDRNKIQFPIDFAGLKYIIEEFLFYAFIEKSTHIQQRFVVHGFLLIHVHNDIRAVGAFEFSYEGISAFDLRIQHREASSGLDAIVIFAPDPDEIFRIRFVERHDRRRQIVGK